MEKKNIGEGCRLYLWKYYGGMVTNLFLFFKLSS